MNKEYIDLLKKIDGSGKYWPLLQTFIETYDGTNEMEFKELMMTLVGMLLKLNQEEVEDKYNLQVDEIMDQYREGLSLIKQDLASIQSGKRPVEPAVSTDAKED